MVNLKDSEIQGFVLSSYTKNMPCASYVLMNINNANQCRDWLGVIGNDITSAAQRKDDYCLNIAFTASALRKLGYTEDELLTFSVAFQEGMTSRTRQQILGDAGINDPANWLWGNAQNPVDILLLVFAKDEAELNQRLLSIDNGVNRTGGLDIIAKLSAGRQQDAHEHFGFLDGIGQPVIEGTNREEKQFNRTGHATVIKAGEFVLGHKNEMDKIDPIPELKTISTFGCNGTYLVFRQLEQHVHTFWNYIKDSAVGADGTSSLNDQEKLAAKMIGRWKSGAPMTSFPDADPASPSENKADNNFSYAKTDGDGFGCPVGAHIRRTNPRDSLFNDPVASRLTVKRHRIMRRGRSYGDRATNVYEDDGKSRGLHFICLNSNIERQFEFVQQSWVNNLNFSTLDHETDPLIGQRSEQNMFSVQGCPVRTRIHNLPDFVTTKGGAYFFMPGIAALRQLCKLQDEIK